MEAVLDGMDQQLEEVRKAREEHDMVRGNMGLLEVVHRADEAAHGVEEACKDRGKDHVVAHRDPEHTGMVQPSEELHVAARKEDSPLLEAVHGTDLFHEAAHTLEVEVHMAHEEAGLPDKAQGQEVDLQAVFRTQLEAYTALLAACEEVVHHEAVLGQVAYMVASQPRTEEDLPEGRQVLVVVVRMEAEHTNLLEVRMVVVHMLEEEAAAMRAAASLVDAMEPALAIIITVVEEAASSTVANFAAMMAIIDAKPATAAKNSIKLALDTADADSPESTTPQTC